MKLADLQHAIHCECCSQEIDYLHDFLADSDRQIAKALVLTEVAQIARTEVRMREFLTAKWRVRADQSAKRAGAIFAGGGTLSAGYAAIDKIMGRWDEEVAPRYGKDIEDVYFLARDAGWKKANGQTSASLQYSTPNFTEQLEKVEKAKRKKRVAQSKPSFDLFDEQAVLQLQDDQMLWIGLHYEKNVRDSIREAVKPGLIEGLGRVEAGKKVSEALSKQLRKVTVPGGFNGTDAKYFEGLAANTATAGRVRGQVRSFVDIGVTRYEIVNPMDVRTSAICQFMNGRIFTIPEATSMIQSESGATDPEQVKNAHPWMSQANASKIHGAGGDRALAKAGLALPTYHFRCRTTVDISTDSISFGSLSKSEQLNVPDRKQPTRRNTPKRSKATSRPSKISPTKRPATIPTTAKTLKAA